MPLPSALASKLSKRGIITAKNASKVGKKEDFRGVLFCPNKYNIYHTCNHWCETTWKGFATPDPVYLKNLQKLLFKYPLPHNWTEVFDKATGRYYYWNMENDLVSWLPSKHPKANPMKSAAKIRQQRAADLSPGDKLDDEKYVDNEDREHRKSHSKSSSKRDERDKDDKYSRKEDKYNYKKARKDILDPMDPASYSDIPPGTWSDGLENKTRADNTASGVLYQQRPYPSPGEILASNKEKYGRKQH